MSIWSRRRRWTTQKRWQVSANGPFLEQHVRVYTGGTAAAVVAALQRAIPGCRSYTVADGGGTAVYRVEPLRVAGAGDDIVSWRQRLTLPAPPAPTTTVEPTAAASPTSPTTLPTATATGTPVPSPTTAQQPAPVLVQDVAVTRRGSSVVLLASYSINQPPQADVLATAVKALGPQR